MPKFDIRKFGVPDAMRVAVTLSIVIAAGIGARYLWTHYRVDPWTRDGRVRADIVQIAPDVSGTVTTVFVKNDQTVKRGDPLFTIDPDRYTLAVRQAEAAVAAQRAALDEVQDEVRRNSVLGDLVSMETVDQTRKKAEALEAALEQAQAALDLARLNLRRTTVYAPADGYLSDLVLRAGDFVPQGKPVIGLIDSGSIRVEGYFEETKLPYIHSGQPVDVEIMGQPTKLRGHVVSVARGIEDRERQPGFNLLPNVSPTFSWVRLAQRVPVRIALDRVPPDFTLISGQTATVVILNPVNRPARAL